MTDSVEPPVSESGPVPRLSAELRLLAMTGMLWTGAALHAAAWAWATGLLPRAQVGTWTLLAGVLLAVFYAVAVALVRDLPLARPRQRAQISRPLALGLQFIPGLIALPLVPWLLWRARRAAASPVPDDAALDQAHAALLQLPRISALRLLTWAAGAYAANAAILGLATEWPRELTIALTLLWVALVGPIAAIAYGWAKATLRSEFLTVPTFVASTFQRTHDMRLRLIVSATIASAGAIVAPLSAGYLWLSSADADTGQHAARRLGDEAALWAELGDSDQLAILLADHPSLTVIANGQTYGAVVDRVPAADGLLDEDRDGIPETFIARRPGVAVIVPLDGAQADAATGLFVGGFACLGCCVLALSLMAVDFGRDIARANEQVTAVAEGRAPPPMSEASLSSLEVRELVQSVDRLVGRITEANVAKYIAIEKAKEADRLKSQFLANMSHDLRSPLNSVLGFSELLVSGIDGDLAESQRVQLQLIHDCGRHLLQQIDDILDTAKIEAGRLDLHPEPTPPATLLNRAVHDAKRRGRSIEYNAEFSPGLPPAFIDPYRAVQAVENVLLFAGERMDEGTIDIRVSRASSEDRRMILIVVRTPVRPATADQLAQARRGFYRIPGHRGLGLGLPIAGSIVELSGGSMGIEDLGEGMEFHLMLPAPVARRTRPLRLGPDPKPTGR